MDDLLNIDSSQSPAQEATHREMERKSNDTIRVSNPTESDHMVYWNGGGHLVPSKTRDIGYGNGQAVLPRYIAMKYGKEMTDRLLDERLLQAVKDENERRVTNNQRPMEKYAGGEEQFFAEQYKPSNPKLRAEILSTLILGLEREWGMDAVLPDTQPRRDIPNVDELVFASLADRPAPASSTPVTPPTEPTENTNGDDVISSII